MHHARDRLQTNNHDCILPDELDANLVVRPTRYDDVGKLLGGHAKLLVGGLDEGEVVLQHLVQLTTQLLRVLKQNFIYHSILF